MPMDDGLAQRGRSLEDDYFRKKDQDLIERMRRAAAEVEARQGLSTQTGLHDPEMLEQLRALGFAPDTVSLLPLLPLVQVAWAEGGVTDAERHTVVMLARARGIADGSAADRQLADWLTTRPAADVFARATRLTRAVLAAQSAGADAITADDLVKYCEAIAGASGGVLGIRKISSDERALIATLAADLKTRHV